LLFFSSLLLLSTLSALLLLPSLPVNVNLPPVSVPLVDQEKSRVMGSYELKSQASITIRSARGATRLAPSVHERDDANLQRMGKKPVLKVQPRPPPPQEDEGKTKVKEESSDQIC